MSFTPAAELARLRVTHKQWRIERLPPGEGQPVFYVAVHREHPIRRHVTRTIAELDQLLSTRRRGRRSGSDTREE